METQSISFRFYFMAALQLGNTLAYTYALSFFCSGVPNYELDCIHSDIQSH